MGGAGPVEPIVLALPSSIARMRADERGFLDSLARSISSRVGHKGGQVDLVVVDSGRTLNEIRARLSTWVEALLRGLPLRNFSNTLPEIRIAQHTGERVTVSCLVTFTRTIAGAFLLFVGDQVFNEGKLLAGLSAAFSTKSYG